MEARNRQKLKLLYIIEILKKYSDEDNPINASEICRHLQSYGITAERKAIYDDIEVLIGCGYDIVKTTLPRRGCFLASREFEIPEICLLQDAVRAAKFISAKKTRELINRLNSMLSLNQVHSREKCLYFDVQGKCANEEIYYTIDSIIRGIEQKRKISFNYCVRRLSENREIKISRKEMIVSPYALTWQDDHYYLIGNYHKYDNLIHLRLDRMRGVQVTDETARHFSEVSEYTDVFDVAGYTHRLFNMHGGEMQEIELCCNKRILEQVIDRFSEKIFIRNITEETFCFSVSAALSEALVTWIINYGRNIKVISPESLRQMVKDRAKAVLEVY